MTPAPQPAITREEIERLYGEATSKCVHIEVRSQEGDFLLNGTSLTGVLTLALAHLDAVKEGRVLTPEQDKAHGLCRNTIRMLASQKTSDQMDEETAENADYESAYDTMCKLAQDCEAAIKATENSK